MNKEKSNGYMLYWSLGLCDAVMIFNLQDAADAEVYIRSTRPRLLTVVPS